MPVPCGSVLMQVGELLDELRRGGWVVADPLASGSALCAMDGWRRVQPAQVAQQH